MKKTLYVSDLDGTLLNTKDELSEYTKQILNILIKQGINFTYATARSFSSASKVTKGLNINLPVIVYNGTMAFDPVTRNMLYQIDFDKEERMELVETISRYDISPIVYSYIKGVERVSWVTKYENYGQRRYIQNRQGDKRMNPLYSPKQLYDGNIFYFTCIGEREELMELYEALLLLPYCTITFHQELYRTEYWLEIMPKKATKASGILRLKEELGYERIISFGDAINDLPMFGISDECYAVYNAVTSLKEKATAVILSNEEDGVARWIKEHAHINYGL